MIRLFEAAEAARKMRTSRRKQIERRQVFLFTRKRFSRKPEAEKRRRRDFSAKRLPGRKIPKDFLFFLEKGRVILYNNECFRCFLRRAFREPRADRHLGAMQKVGLKRFKNLHTGRRKKEKERKTSERISIFGGWRILCSQ